MKSLRLIGVVLILAGGLFFVLSNVNFRHEEDVVRIGTFRATATTSRTVPTFRYIGTACLGAGAVLLIVGFLRR